jgi:hypothetical protein
LQIRDRPAAPPRHSAPARRSRTAPPLRAVPYGRPGTGRRKLSYGPRAGRRAGARAIIPESEIRAARILIVDDQPPNVALLTGMLEGEQTSP